MSDEAQVLAECAAAPDDDGPRLVWADLVGGERGELVVLQCDLARGDLSLEEARVRSVRVAELLAQHAATWAGSLANVARRWSFRRGFVEAARFGAPTETGEWPLLRSITVDSWPAGAAFPRLDQIRALGIGRVPDRGLPPCPKLRALSVDGLDETQAENIIGVIAGAPLETLRLRRQRLEQIPITRVLEVAPRLVALEFSPDGFGEHRGLDAAVQLPLRALRLGHLRVNELRILEGSPAAATVEHLAFGVDGGSAGLADLLARLPRLCSLEITNCDLEDPRLQPRSPNELVHEAPAAMGSLGTPCTLWSQPAVIARIDRPTIFDVPVFPADEHVLLGRGSEIPLRLLSGTVARRHAALFWRDGAHMIKDLGSTNGISFNGARVDNKPLADGDELVLGEVFLRYFIGPGARDRAVAAISGLSSP